MSDTKSDINILALLNKVIREVEEDEDFPEVTSEVKFSSLGMDSIVTLEIIGKIEDELDITIPDDQMVNIQTIGDVEKIILTQLNKRKTHSWWK